MTLIDRARHLLTCDELRGRVPDEVAEFLREVVALEPEGYTSKYHLNWEDGSEWSVYQEYSRNSPIPLYTLETPHDAG